MAVQKSRNSFDSNDITRNLPSLQFSHALTDEEKNLMLLRKRSHAMTVSACAQATYIIPILNEARQTCMQLNHPEGRKVGRLMADASLRNPLLIGIIGCGRLGSHLANCLLTFGEVNPNELKISTRRPETLVELQDKGVKCMYDNKAVASSCHLLILCILPSQLPAIAEEIKGRLSPLCLVYSMVSAMPLSRIQQLLGTDSIVRPEYTWDVANADRSWDNSLDVSAAFAVPEMVELTCPLSFNKEEAIVETDSKFAEAVIYALCNLCTSQRLNREDTLEVVNAVILGDSPKTPIGQKLKIEDFTRVITKDKYFPKFDLCAIIGRETPLTQPLNYSRKIRQCFIDKYCLIFSQYLNWNKRCTQPPR